MTQDPAITHVAYHLPGRVDDVGSWGRRARQYAAVPGLERAGMHRYHRATGQTAIGLAASAIRQVMLASCVAADTIDCLVYVHTLQGSIAPPPMSLPGLLCDHFGFTHAETFSLAQQHCASALGALRVIRAMFVARPHMRRVLLVGADVMPLEPERLMRGEGIMGDGAFAALVQRGGATNRLLAVGTHCSGLGWRGTSGLDSPSIAARQFLAARSLISTTLRQAHCPPEDLQLILPHHLDLPAWYRLLDSLRIPRERLFASNFGRVGHVTVSDPFINLADCDDVLVPGRPFLLFARGVGGFCAAAVLCR
ncbi:MAG: 3-oxoacyl-[acyl-carrier-protein] synthase III C-terminal domain-containing protein [Paraburkholderia sp.]|jgi:3-oxoacyl-[acyl-carrier-protein] synthase III|uniref:3-oxoacyl-[acyl-carrier-protein] synthase III C-terminal domain-containing protein n=1 Tax=unclassified Paraburkholderia TaxID=2615204 RepID=UPI00285DCABC|nr:3-oxoacyl-[acyl-carrier-protein] synthase III C-terminal domain-containing protein [Paraburkholderia sp. USG1]MDR8394889.1 3-oxoacyl-ACP synthase [Paraburkholderia sp. USG1]